MKQHLFALFLSHYKTCHLSLKVCDKGFITYCRYGQQRVQIYPKLVYEVRAELHGGALPYKLIK